MIPEKHEQYYRVVYANGWNQLAKDLVQARAHIELMKHVSKPLRIESVVLTELTTIIEEWENAD